MNKLIIAALILIVSVNSYGRAGGGQSYSSRSTTTSTYSTKSSSSYSKPSSSYSYSKPTSNYSKSSNSYTNSNSSYKKDYSKLTYKPVTNTGTLKNDVAYVITTKSTTKLSNYTTPKTMMSAKNKYDTSYYNKQPLRNYNDGRDFYNARHISESTGYGIEHPFNNPLYWMLILNHRNHDRYYVNSNDDNFDKLAKKKLLEQVCADFYWTYKICVEHAKVTNKGVVVSAKGKDYLATYNDALRKTEFKQITKEHANQLPISEGSW